MKVGNHLLKHSVLLTIWIALCFLCLPALSVPPGGGGPHDNGPSGGETYGEGTWINVTASPLCGQNTGRVCAEFVDKVAGSPYTGVFCCVDSQEISLGRFSSCAYQFSRPPREDED